MKSSLIYLAGAIYEQDDTCIRWRKATSLLLRKKGIMSLSPTDADYRGKEQSRFIPETIVKKDKRDIMSADTILAKCEIPSFGTSMEIMFAWSLRKQIIVVTNSFSPWIRYHADEIYPTLEEAINSLEYPTFDPSSTR